MIQQYKKYIIGFAVAISIAIVLQLALEYITALPPFITNSLQTVQGNKELMQETGGYQGFESFYNPNDMETKDTIDFLLIIKGRYKQVKFIGKASRNEEGIWSATAFERAKE